MDKKLPRAIVGALIFNSTEQVFLMKSSGKYQDNWIIPGGKIDFGETMIEALKREIWEETNMQIGKIEFCGVRELVEAERHFVFLEFKAFALNPHEIKLNNEATEYGWFSKNDLSKIKIANPTMELINERWK